MGTSDLANVSEEFLALFKAGKEAARNGQKEKAHKLFRRAIEIDPYHEQVWLWLASVVETDEDRRVCFENVLQINPSNPVAHRQLRHLEERAIAAILRPTPPRKKRPAWQGALAYLVVTAIIIGITVMLVLVLGLI